jgi:hypothetical protein
VAENVKADRGIDLGILACQFHPVALLRLLPSGILTPSILVSEHRLIPGTVSSDTTKEICTLFGERNVTLLPTLAALIADGFRMIPRGPLPRYQP